jgi:peptidoglycan/LPS O-acetylase OafA/YrhL
VPSQGTVAKRCTDIPNGINVRIDNLTCARFFAALLVLLHHSARTFPMSETPRLFLDNGYMGVTFFFVLSGFVIAASSAEEMSAPTLSTVVHFYIRRIARVVPVWLFLSLPTVSPYVQRHQPLQNLLVYLTFTQAWSGDLKTTFSFLALSWTLSCEMFFYLVYPLFAFCVARLIRARPSALFVLTIVAVIVPWLAAAWFNADPARAALNSFDPASPHRWLYRFPALRFCEFAFGVCLNLIWRRYADAWRSAPMRKVWWMLGALAVGSVIALMALASPGPFTWTAAYILPYGLLVVALTALERRERLRSAGFVLLVLLGEASYSFYLVHQIFVLPYVFFPERSWISLAWTIVYCAAVSVGLFTLIETPMRKLITGFIKDRRATEVSPAIRGELSELGKGA